MQYPKGNFLGLDIYVTSYYNKCNKLRIWGKYGMELTDLIERFSKTTENQCKAVFSTLFIAGNRLQTLFDNRIPEISLKQFMLLSLVRQSKEPLTFTQLGSFLGCSRQNIKKLADALEKKGFIAVQKSPYDTRAMCICPTEKTADYFQKDFVKYQEELKYLFEVYTGREIETLFILLSKLYEGIDNLEKKTADEKVNTDRKAEWEHE